MVRRLQVGKMQRQNQRAGLSVGRWFLSKQRFSMLRFT